MKSIRNLLAGTVLAAGTLLTAAAGISIASAADEAATSMPPSGPQGWHHHGEGRLLAQLNLTAEQHASIKAIMANAAPQMKSIHEQMRANFLKLHQMQPNDPNYANVTAQVSQAQGALHSQMIAQQAEVRASVFKVLTPAQQTQLTALEAQMPAHGHEGWGPHGAAGAPPPPAQ
jgi:periplasmic protein CpxP/Spy